MPIQYYHTSILTAIGNMIGKLIKIDYHTQSAQRGKFARIAIEIDVSMPLIPDFYLDDCKQTVEYENLPNVCFTGGRIGHRKEDCLDDAPVIPTTPNHSATQLPQNNKVTFRSLTSQNTTPNCDQV
ncbi:unnamed protein product [Linum tenue]|uniref:CCHC-type domain-containing protein n=1 Tax=Linum tenue TaxID=586396 RepID=A0AAV0NXC3_9ROSI|nr:unnamed protein product [Linum tenue]